MLSFKRKYSVTIQRNTSSFLGVSVVLFNIVWNVGFNTLYPEMASAPFYERIFGRNFLNNHAWMLLGFFVTVFLGLGIHKMMQLSTTEKRITTLEIETYNKRYGADFSFPQINPWFYFAVPVCSLIFLFFVLIAYQRGHNLDIRSHYLIFGMGFIVLCSLFYGILERVKKRENTSMNDIFKHANATIPQTHIKIINYDLDHSILNLSATFSLNLEGQYRGRAFSLKHETSGFSMGRHVLTGSEGEICLETKNALKINLLIKEKNPFFNKIKGSTLNQCFKERFKVKGMKVEQIPDSFKKDLLESFINFDLEIKPGLIIQKLHSEYLFPFYSTQGIILFLDFLIDLESELVNK